MADAKSGEKVLMYTKGGTCKEFVRKENML
jgi:hypothetical protein